MSRGKGLFITATDTGVGKTVVTAGLALALQEKGYKVAVMKPVQSGNLREDPAGDGMCLKQWTRSSEPIERIVLYHFTLPVAPGVAAEKEGQVIELEQILRSYQDLAAQYDIVLVEGAGGLLVPLGRNWTVADLAKAMELPLLIVARPNLGTVNHTALTALWAKQKGLHPVGVVINGWSEELLAEDPSVAENPQWMEQLAGIPVLGKMPWLSELTTETIREASQRSIDLQPLVQIWEAI
ncbi:dethiobiotin synthase [Thermoflavimicrobium dichotomicum]|uniref:ATP-dependent dethiobiotin synthetase BioD n=1 Tax=Thermoflavimicrobium dichotomicum TaxID=46223 RepID=A0A1I3PY57_9BACL|nr:dethiobiotin synthase [Thermoflavimicrobium dichotomicum]SFJ26360.1 dethiobiotin synthetase [Thermoflavimicrobium dichotomicum]